jgi:hypothetical protein
MTISERERPEPSRMVRKRKNARPAMSFRTAESLLKFRSQIDAMAPGRDKSNDGTIGDTSHQARPSDHNPNKDGVVTAMDITHDPRHGVDAGELAEILRLSKDPRIKYVISNRRIFSSEKSPWQWRPYNGANAHTHHVHVSVMGEKALYDDTHPWPIEPRAKVIEPPQRRPGGRLTNITATVFGGAAEFKRSAYDNHVITDDELGVALPFHFSGTRPKVRVSNPMNGASVVCDVVDMGPWNTNDPYWENGGRPQAESGTARDGRRTNLAGIDLTPAAARQLGIDDKGEVEWEFVSPAAPEHSTEFSLLGRLMQRLDHIEDAIADNARRIDPGFAPRDTSSTPTPMPGLIPDFMPDLMPCVGRTTSPPCWSGSCRWSRSCRAKACLEVRLEACSAACPAACPASRRLPRPSRRSSARRSTCSRPSSAPAPTASRWGSARSTARSARPSAICSTARRPRSACSAPWPRRC